MNKFLVQADTAAQMTATLTRHDTGAVIDLSNASVLLKVKQKGTTIVLFTLTGTGTSSELALGIVTFSFDSNLDTLVGFYEGEIEIIYQDSTVESVYELIYFQVREDF